ncbi:hypothetical protein [Ruegeria sp. HKCCA5491]|uniref:hypothetical protein n=1 Tax=Ruegeria sp. HKCCA5491 TaxID=2682986 RepID=UPI00148A0F9F|nr:hypothetical protein [Ruegeria sp. HKCCA5491]
MLDVGLGIHNKNSGNNMKIQALVLALATVIVAASAIADENASNPLAAVNNTDIRYQYFDLGNGADKQDAFIDGAYMLRPDLKLKYELHYNSTDVTGTRFTDFEKLSLKAIYFPSQRPLNETWAIKSAIGLEWILDFGDPEKGIGTGSDQIAPFGGFAFANTKSGLTLIPLLQHFASYNGPTDINQTAMRLIALQPFGDGYWAKADIKAPYDWENDAWPATAEFQIGKNLSPGIAIYADFLIGIGSDRPYDKGAGLGLRFNY